MKLYEVTATQSRKIRRIKGRETAMEGYVAYKGYIRANSESEAIYWAKIYLMVPGTKYNSIRAELVEE